MEMEWIKEKPPLEKEKSNKEISKQIDQNAKATTNLLEKVRKYGANIFEPFLLTRAIKLLFQMMIDKTATLAELETAVKANCNAIKRETEMDLSKKDKSKAIIKAMFDHFRR